MNIQDNRTEEQKRTHRFAVVAKDKFMSGWGNAKGGASRCAWACGPEIDINRLFAWVSARPEMSRAAIVDLDTYQAPRGTKHFTIYVCDRSHRSQR